MEAVAHELARRAARRRGAPPDAAALADGGAVALSEGYGLPSSDEILRRRPLRRLVEPWYERRHVYRVYAAFLDRLVDAGVTVLPLRDLRVAVSADAPLLGLRHDVDDRLGSALALARLERERGLRATYFVLHSARYYSGPTLVPALRELQELGHEVGFHYDLVTLQVVEGEDPRAYLGRELGRLREAGIDVVGVAAHGARAAHRLRYKNEYFFRELSSPQVGFPNVDVVSGLELQKATLEEYGLEYDASQLAPTHYWTDSWTDAAGRRWHPELADVSALRAGDRAVMLLHPCHWNRSLATKYACTLRRLAARLLRR